MNISNESVIEFEDEKLTEYCGEDTVFIVKHLLSSISEHLTGDEELQAQWIEGVSCSVLMPGHKWQRGKLTLSFDFVPDNETESADISHSPLDDIRQNSGT